MVRWPVLPLALSSTRRPDDMASESAVASYLGSGERAAGHSRTPSGIFHGGTAGQRRRRPSARKSWRSSSPPSLWLRYYLVGRNPDDPAPDDTRTSSIRANLALIAASKCAVDHDGGVGPGDLVPSNLIPILYDDRPHGDSPEQRRNGAQGTSWNVDRALEVPGDLIDRDGRSRERRRASFPPSSSRCWLFQNSPCHPVSRLSSDWRAAWASAGDDGAAPARSCASFAQPGGVVRVSSFAFLRCVRWPPCTATSGPHPCLVCDVVRSRMLRVYYPPLVFHGSLFPSMLLSSHAVGADEHQLDGCRREPVQARVESSAQQALGRRRGPGTVTAGLLRLFSIRSYALSFPLPSPSSIAWFSPVGLIPRIPYLRFN